MDLLTSGSTRLLVVVAPAFLLIASNLALASLLAAVSVVLERGHFGLFARLQTSSWLLGIIGVAALDLATYVAHVSLHKVPLAWRFHSDPEVDVTTKFRQHPGETLWRVMWLYLGTAVLGLPLWVFAIYQTLSSLNGLLEHANISLNPPVELTRLHYGLQEFDAPARQSLTALLHTPFQQNP